MKLYSPYQIEQLTNKQIRHEYSKLRATANKRLLRLQAAGLGSRGDFRYPKVKDLTSGELAAELANVSRFLRDPRTTVSGEKKYVSEEITQLHEKGYDWINRSNFYEFIDFMEEMRGEMGGRYFDSGDAADVFNEGQRLNIPSNVLKKNFDYFAQNLSAVEKVQPIRTNKTVRFSDIKRKMKRYL